MTIPDFYRSTAEVLLDASLRGSVLIVVVFALQRLLGRFLSPGWCYFLWCLVLLRLLLPFNVSAPWSEDRVWDRILDEGRQVVGSQVTEVQEPTATVLPPPFRPAAELAGPGTAGSAFPWVLVFLVVWALGLLFLAVQTLIANQRLYRVVRKSRAMIDPRVLAVLEDCKAELAAYVPLNVIATDVVDSPALIGFLRPRLLLPRHMVEALDEAELRQIFLHELAHFRRMDVFANWVMAAAQMIHWFNPLVWWAVYQMRGRQELACDHWVLQRTGQPQPYGRTMIKVLELSAGFKREPGMVGLLEDKRFMERRIRRIADFRRQRAFAAPIGVILCLSLAFLSFTKAEQPRDAYGVLQQLQHAYNQKDFNRLMNLYHEDVVFQEQDETGLILSTSDKDGLAAWYRFMMTYSHIYELGDQIQPQGLGYAYTAKLRTGMFEVVGLYESSGRGLIRLKDGRIIEQIWSEDTKAKQRRLRLFDQFLAWVKKERPQAYQELFQGTDLFIHHRAVGQDVTDLFFQWLSEEMEPQSQ